MHHDRSDSGAGRHGTPGTPTKARAVVPAVALVLLALGACQPTVRVQAPDKPIVINLNVKIEQDVRVRLEKGVEEALDKNPDIF